MCGKVIPIFIFDKLLKHKQAPQKSTTPKVQAVKAKPTQHGDDGWVEMQDGKILVHDPSNLGRFATIQPELGLHVWVNDELVTETTVVTAGDLIRYELDTEQGGFFHLSMDEEKMSVTLIISSDPKRRPDTVALTGQHPARIHPGYSTKAEHREIDPKKVILDQLAEMGVVYGVDEAAIDAALRAPTGQPTVVARGQEASEYEAGSWTWFPDEWGMVEPGQVIAVHEDEKLAQEQILVTGEHIDVYGSGDNGEQGYIAGPGTRMVYGGRLVASTSGRARQSLAPGGRLVRVMPVREIEGDLTSPLSAEGDLLVRGSVHRAKVSATGEIFVAGDVDQSELKAGDISIRGSASHSQLYVCPTGHFVPLRGELAFLQHRLEELREQLENDRPIKEQSYRETAQFTRALRRKADEIGVTHQGFLKVTADIITAFSSLDGAKALNLRVLGLALSALEELMAEGEKVAGSGEVNANALNFTVVWAGRHIAVTERAVGSALYSGDTIQTAPTASLSRTEILAGGEATLGLVVSVRGTASVNIRARRVIAEELQAGTTFEFGAERWDFKRDQMRIAVGISARGELVVRSKEE